MIQTDPDSVTWEAVYADGTIDIERHGATYGNIRRGCLRLFRLHSPRGMVYETSVPFGQTGRNLIYRRRSFISPKGKRTVFIVGWEPQGPVLLIDPAEGAIRYAHHFVVGDAEMYPPEFLPEEGASELHV